MSKTTKKTGPWRWLGVTVVVLAVAGVATALSLSGGAGSSTMTVPTYTVDPGPLTISVSETGTVKSREQVVIKSEVEGQTTILTLVPEGTRVSKGELLVELDASSLEDRKVEQQISVQNAEASYIRARENHEVAKNQAAADVAQAELDARFAKEDLATYKTGEYPKQLKELQSKIVLAKAELERAEEKADGSQILYNEKYISESELEADKLSAQRAKLDAELAEQDLELFNAHTHPRKLDELGAAVEQARMALERATRKASADVVQAEADLRAKESEYQRQQTKLEKIDDQIAKTKIYAPQDGLVVYATSTRASWRGNDEPLEEGQQVRERQELIVLPATDAMMAEVKIQESSLDIVGLDMPVRITVDALPGKMFTGKVAKIAPLPDASAMFMNPDLKVYDTQVVFNESDPALRTGMSCTVEIYAARYPDAVYVPIQAVVRHGTQPMVYVQDKIGFTPRPVSIGLDNNRVVHVTEGLSAGEQVSLAPPLDAAARAVAEDVAAGMDIPATTAAEVKTTPAASPAPSPAAEPAPVGAEAQAPAAENAEQPAGRPDVRNMTDEQRQQMRQRFENMTPEQREQMRQQWQQRRQQRDGAGNGNGGAQ